MFGAFLEIISGNYAVSCLELELIMRDPDYLMMIEDASFFHEDSKNIRSASLSGRRVATPFFDETFCIWWIGLWIIFFYLVF